MTTPGDGFPELLTAREVAQILRVSERSVWRFVADKKLTAPLHVGGAARWQRGDLEVWLKDAAKIRDAKNAHSSIENQGD